MACRVLVWGLLLVAGMDSRVGIGAQGVDNHQTGGNTNTRYIRREGVVDVSPDVQVSSESSLADVEDLVSEDSETNLSDADEDSEASLADSDDFFDPTRTRGISRWVKELDAANVRGQSPRYTEIIASGRDYTLNFTRNLPGRSRSNIMRTCYTCWVKGTTEPTMKAKRRGGNFVGHYNPPHEGNDMYTRLKQLCSKESGSTSYGLNIIRDNMIQTGMLAGDDSDDGTGSYGWAIWKGATLHKADIARPQILQKSGDGTYSATPLAVDEGMPTVGDIRDHPDSYLLFFAKYFVNNAPAGYIGWRCGKDR